MRYALVDNSTISGVQRLLGDIAIKNTIGSDADILCLENLLQAILFYDQVVVLDDYKAAYSEARKSRFPFIQFYKLPQKVESALLSEAKRQVENIVPRVEAGQFKDSDFAEFFKLLKMNVTFTWDMTSSVYWLNQKMLAGVGGVDLDKYSKLADSIYFELSDRGASTFKGIYDNRCILVSSSGAPIPPTSEGQLRGLSKQASAFFAGLNWLALRTIYFSLVASHLRADLLLHPIRHAFHMNWLLKVSQADSSIYKPVIDAFNGKANAAINKITLATQPVISKLQLPLFSAWLATQSNDPGTFLERANELRLKEPFVGIRKWLIEIEELVESAPNEYLKKVNKAHIELEKCFKSLAVDFKVETAQGKTLSSIIKLTNFFIGPLPWHLVPIPDLGFESAALQKMSANLQGRFVSPLYRSVVEDLGQVARLGSLFDVLKSKVIYDEGADAYLAKTEDVGFQKVTSHWKMPM